MAEKEANEGLSQDFLLNSTITNAPCDKSQFRPVSRFEADYSSSV
jgi:hypothetical protein